MNIRNIWRDTAGYLIVGLIALLVVGLFLIPVYIFDRPKSVNEWLLDIGILFAIKIFISPLFNLICNIYDRVYFGIFRRRRKVKKLSVWKSWAMDILVSPGTSDKYKIADAINERYAEFKAKDQLETRETDINNAVDQITGIVKKVNWTAMKDKLRLSKIKQTVVVPKSPLEKGDQGGC